MSVFVTLYFYLLQRGLLYFSFHYTELRVIVSGYFADQNIDELVKYDAVLL